MNAPDPLRAQREFKNHDLVDDIAKPGVRYEKRPAHTPDGAVAPGLYNAWITLDNPTQFNSYTTDMVKGVILAFRAASNARDVSSVVFTGARKILARTPAPCTSSTGPLRGALSPCT